VSDLKALLADARGIWGDRRMSLPEIAVALGVVHGDICRLARDDQEGLPATRLDLERELGNLILSAIRWADDQHLGLSDCLHRAELAQRAYVEKR
jgi:hypothetical protein